MDEQSKEPERVCFVIMPIADPEGYAPGHFERVYDHLVRPACESAGFVPTRADDVSQTNYIMIDVLRKIVQSEMVLCDLSARNPNVMYELGIRQAYNKPVTLIKDERTPRVFDTQGLRTTEYSSSLRVDAVVEHRAIIAASLRATASPGPHDVNSLVDLLGIAPAEQPRRIEVSPGDTILLRAIEGIADRLSGIESRILQERMTYIPPSDEPESGNELWRKLTEVGLGNADAASDQLNARELEILRLVAEGHSNQNIATSLGMSMNTVRTHVSNLFRKLRAGSRTELVVAARRVGLI